MARRPPKPPRYPAIDVWFERIDAGAYALFASRQWERGPRLTVWRIVDLEPGGDPGWRGRGAAMLMAVEETLQPRWYIYAQRGLEKSVNEWGEHDLSQLETVKTWNAHVARVLGKQQG